ncbi:MAG: amidohydrolase family protein [Novosphingobium sp.]|nr:amidohydrolase family protein [Novosphingobium sp.]
MLIRNAELWHGSDGGSRGDVLIEGGHISRVGKDFAAPEGARVLEAGGGLLLPGLHDHHVHLAGLAVRKLSVWCGPPDVMDGDALSAALVSAKGDGWIRAIGYHESVLGGLPDAKALDRLIPQRPLRMQHRSGRMWLLNSAALDLLLSQSKAPSGLEREHGRFTGRLFDEDAWMREALGSAPPDFAAISSDLSRQGVTGVTDMTPQNDPEMAAHFAAQRRSGALAQSVRLAGTLDLAFAAQQGWTLGPVKLHLHEADLPPFDQAVDLVRKAHDQVRPIAVHCVSEVELVFTLAFLEEAGSISGDRIEHASIASPEHLSRITDLGLAVCVQPHFVTERGDQYLADVEPRLHRDLYRLQSLRAAGIAMAGGSDAPFGGIDPWAAMQAAVSRATHSGAVISPEEALSPEQALSLWLADPADLSRQRELEPGAPADLCLLNRPWEQVRDRLTREDVALTIASGRIVHQIIDQPPFEGRTG